MTNLPEKSTDDSSRVNALNINNSKAVAIFAYQSFTAGLLLIATFISVDLSAQTISPQMLEQFQKMPKAQQEMMASQYGIDLDDVMGDLMGPSSPSASLAKVGEPIEPRVVDGGDESLQQNSSSQQDKLVRAFEQYLANEKKGGQRYGLSLFDADVSTFAPTDDASVPGDYRLGAGDNVVVQLFGTENEEFDLQVTRDGHVNFRKLGPIAVAGLTFENAKALIQSRVSDQLLGAQATISMGRLRAINIFMAGEVSSPGAYSVSALTTITQALFQAGGIGDIGSLRNIQVKRNGVTVDTFDAYQLLLKGDASGDVRLQSGDVVFVPPFDGIVTVNGAVRRPMVYEFIGGESVADAVAMAGGLNQDAYGAGIGVVSKAVGTALPGATNIDLTSAAGATFKLRNGDKIRVPESTRNLENAVTLKGAVVRPGVYGWVKGQRISDLISSVASDLKPYADLGYGLVVRQKNSRLDIEVLQIDLGEAIENVDSLDNILTAPRDRIIVFGLPGVAALGDIDSVTTNPGANTLRSSGGTDFAAAYNSAAVEFEQHTIADAVTSNRMDADLKAVERRELLKPVIEKLKSQARSGEPVQIISISGAVKLPGDYPLGSKDTVAKLVAAAGGLKDSAYLDSAELRSLYLGKNRNILSRYRNVNLGIELEAVSGTALRSRDHLNVSELPDWNPTNAVTLDGEVRFPGTYRIGKNERLADVIARAGGLTQIAFQEGAVFSRKSISALEQDRSKQFAQSIIRDFASSQLTKEETDVKIEDIQAIAEILENFEGSGRLLVDINAALSGDPMANITLEDGDILSIPQDIYTVTVVGEIRRPGTHTFQAGLDLNDYLGLSAGLTARAEEKELYVVRADGSVLRPSKSWFRFAGGKSTLGPGDTIVVPIDAGYTDNLTLWREVTQVIFNTTAGLASIAAVTR
jgi:polysaccharide export outer membrane protein